MPQPILGRMLGLTLLLASAGPLHAEPATVLATVNGAAVDQAQLDDYTERRNNAQGAPPEMLLQELINLELLVQDAVAKNLEQEKDYLQEMATIRRSLLAQLAVRQFVESHPVSEAEVRKIYQQQVDRQAGEELKARHILLKSEDDAKAVITALDGGGDFAALAKERSTGPSGPQGGDLGWFAADQMVPEFSAAAVTLEKGKYSSAPVQTQFGWHVILLEDKRPVEPPPFEELKEQIENTLQSQQVRGYVEGLRQAAKIDIVEAEAPDAPAAPVKPAQ